MTSHRQAVKAAIFEILDSNGIPADVLPAFIAAGVFDALGITPEEQELSSGYFLLHAGLKDVRADTPENTKRPSETGSLVPDHVGEFNTLVNTSVTKNKFEDHVYHNTTVREAQLLHGSKYTAGEFKGFSSSEWLRLGVQITLKTPICTYTKFYPQCVVEDDARSDFVASFYHQYLEDYDREENLRKDGNSEEWAETGKSGDDK